MTHAGLQRQEGEDVSVSALRCQRSALKPLRRWCSPGLARHLKHNPVAAVEYGHDDEKDQEQEADEEDDGLDGHSCKAQAQRTDSSGQ